MPKSTRHSKRSAPTGHITRLQRVFPMAAASVAIVTLTLFMATLVAANSLATEGGSTGDVSAKIASLQNENANLETQAAELTAVSRIYNEALSRGYVQPDKVLYTTPPQSPVAMKQ